MRGATFKGRPCIKCGSSEKYVSSSKCAPCVRVSGRRSQEWDRRLLRRYGLVPEQYEALIIEQVGLCGVCFEPLTFGQGKAAVDHDHTDGAVRGLLCQPCNALLGAYEKALTMKDRLDEYLRRKRIPSAY